MTNKINKPTEKQPTVPAENKKNLSFGQKAADWISSAVGSWAFLISLFVILAIWMILNGVQLLWSPWDPYPYILLNFVLSCLAAVQAPVILMSQNRSTERDRLRFEYDYHINRKAEREIQLIQKELKSIKTYLQKINKNLK